VAPPCVPMFTPIKPMTRRERRFARQNRLLLLRNVRRVRAMRERLSRPASVSGPALQDAHGSVDNGLYQLSD